MVAQITATRLADAACFHHLSLCDLPDELLIHVLRFLDVSELFQTSRTSRHLRILSFDPLLHALRRKHAHERVQYLLPRRPPLYVLQPPISTIYLTRTHVAARKLHWSLVSIRLQRSLSRRPKLSTLCACNIIPVDCCKRDRRSGEIIWGSGVAGTLVERKRKVEREQIKEGLRVWLERKAREIRARKKEGGVGVLVWRFSRKLKLDGAQREPTGWCERPKKEKVSSMKRYWEDLIASP